MPTNALVQISPQAISYTGGTATIETDGTVSFTGCSYLQFRYLFTSDYDTYMAVMSCKSSANQGYFYFRATNGTTDRTNNYAYQNLYIEGSTETSGRFSSLTYIPAIAVDDGLIGGATMHFFGPQLVAYPSFRATSASAYNNATIQEVAGMCDVSGTWDGFSFSQYISGTLTGRIAFYAYQK